MMGWQWHQLDHMQIICTLLQTDNHNSTSPLSFYMPDALPAAQPTASAIKALKALCETTLIGTYITAPSTPVLSHPFCLTNNKPR